MSKGLKWPIWAIVGAAMLFLNGCAALRWADGTNYKPKLDPHVYELPVHQAICIEQAFYAAYVAYQTNLPIRIVIGVVISEGKRVGHAQAQIFAGERWQGLELWQNHPYIDRHTKFVEVYEALDLPQFYERFIKTIYTK